MDREQILHVIRELARSQGFYGRLLESYSELRDRDPEEFDRCMMVLEAQNFQDTLDVVLYFES